MKLTLRELRTIIQYNLREDLFTRGMHTSPTSTGNDREQLRRIAQDDPEDDPWNSHLGDSEQLDKDDCMGPVPPGNPSVVDNISIGSDPYVSDWAAINSKGISR